MGYKMDTRPGPRITAVAGILSALLFFQLAAGGAYAAENYAQRLDRAETLLKRQEGAAALALFKTLIAERPTFSACLGAARASAVADEPESALRYYRHALDIAGDNAMERRLSLFGIARMLMWLERYQEAEKTYEELLSHPLSKEDHAVAAAGQVRSLAFQDKPMRAYRIASAGSEPSSSERVELARSALWAGWPDKAEEMLRPEIVLEPDTRMARELEALRSDVHAQMANPVELHGEYISDSDDLRIRKSELAARMKISAIADLGLAVQNQGFEQHDQHLAMNSLQARYSSRPADTFWLSFQAGPAKYGEWRTALWSGSMVYHPNDETRYELFISREAVETFLALNDHITLDTAVMTAAYTPVSKILLSASLYRQSFSDDNDRLGGTVKFAVPVSRRVGLDVQLRARYFEDSRTDTIGYFNPVRFHEENLLLAFDKRLGSDWRFSALAGPGIQNTSPGDGSTNTLLAEASLRGRIVNGLSLSLDYGYSNSAVASSSGYRRNYAGITLSYQW